VKSLLEEYFEGSLAEPQATAVADHVATCLDCAADLRQIERVVAALEAVPAAVPTEALLHLISARTAELPEPGAGRMAWLGRWRWAVAAAGAGMTVVGAVASAVGVLVWLGFTSAIPGSGWAASAGAFLRQWVDTTSAAMIVLWEQALDIAYGLGIALKAAAPTIGVYLAAEIGILLAIVLVLHMGRRREATRPMVLL
jgi:anti-sigma factor RsiW